MLYAKVYNSGITASSFGVTLANYAVVASDGSASNGLLLGTFSADPVRIGSNSVTRLQVHSGGDFEVKNNQYLTGSVDRRIKLGDSGVSGISTSNNAVYVRGNDDNLILNCAGNGHISFTDNGVEGMKLLNNTLSVQGDVVAYSSSDYRLKDNVKEIDNALDKVSQIRGVEFDWNEKQSVYEGHDIGVIAQEVEKVAPEIVVTRDDGYKAVNYQKLTALLIEAVKELKEEIKELKKDK